MSNIPVEDARWMGAQLARLSDAQLRDAFRAAGYEPDLAARYITKLREKIQQGQALTLAAARN
jgi:hypothetical protein